MTTTKRAAILQAVARGWCHEANSAKEMDSDLAEAITAEVCASLAEQAAEEVPTGCPYPRKCQFHGCVGECQATTPAEQAEPVTAMIGKCQQCGHEHEIPPAPAAAEQAEPVAWRYRYSAKARWNYADGPANDPAVQEEPLYAAPPAPARQEWQPIETAPKTGAKIIVRYVNRNNKPRTVMARWLTDEQAEETDADGVGLKGGWYECIDNWDDYTEVAIHEGEPSLWMPLPAAPITAAPAEGGAAAKPAPASAVEDELSSACIECGGSGMRDSGGVYPWGEAVLEPCDCEQAAPAEGGAAALTQPEGGA